MNDKWLRGGSFQNRYKITGLLTTRTSLHIGSGEEIKHPGEEDIKVSAVSVDFDKKPYIPGSTLRGNLRNWLLQIFQTISSEKSPDALAYAHDYEGLSRQEEYKKQKKQIEFMKHYASVLERLFGTSFSASKLDVWDSPCTTLQNEIQISSGIKDPSRPPYWSAKRMTYVTQSVAIDPETGAAAEQKLYHFEVVPKGVSFRVVLAGQNLTDEELGMILFALQGFNSNIFPVTLGAMTARSFGQFNWKPEELYVLNRSNVQEWAKKAIENDHAGYEGLIPLKDRYDEYIQNFKKVLQKALEVSHADK